MKKETAEQMEKFEEDQDISRDREAFERRLYNIRFPVPRPTDRYDRAFEIPRNEFSRFTSCGDFSYGLKALNEERRLVARVAELKAQGCEIRPGETLEEFVERNSEEVR